VPRSIRHPPASTTFFLGLTTPPRAWRPGLEPAELSFRVPHFFHQTRRGSRGTINLHDAHFPGNRKIIDVLKIAGALKNNQLIWRRPDKLPSFLFVMTVKSP
jgi:hypothetical protein